jgi:hypothetical protein
VIVSVAVDGVEHEVVPTAGDLVRLERQYGISAASLDESTVRVEHVLYIAFTALRRRGAISEELSFDDFIDLADVPDSAPLDPPPPLQQT